MPLKPYTKYLITLIPLVFVAFLAYYFSDIVTYVVMAWVVAMVGDPINDFYRRYLSKNLSAGLTLLTFSLIFVAILWLFIPTVIQQARNFANVNYEQLASNLEEPINDWKNWLNEKGILTEDNVLISPIETKPEKNTSHVEVIQIDSMLNKVSRQDSVGITLVLNINVTDFKDDDVIETENQEEFANFFDTVKNGFLELFDPSRIPKLFGSIIGFFGNLLVAVLSTFFIAFFFLREKGLFTKMIKSMVPNVYEERSVHAVEKSADMLVRYFLGVALQISVITILITGVLTFLGYKNALLIGFFAALMNVIPYLGPLLGGMFGVIITISSNLDVSFYSELLPKILKIIAVFAGMQVFDNYLLHPNIFSKSVKAHPLEIFLVVLVGAKLGGILGMIVAIPIYTVIRVVSKVFLSEFKIVQRITENI